MGLLSFVSYKVNSSQEDGPPLGGGVFSHSQTLPAHLPQAPRYVAACLGGAARPICVVGSLPGRGRPPTGPTHPPQSLSVCKGLSGTGSNKQSQVAKTQGLIMQFTDFPGLFVLSHQLPGAL